MFQFKIRFSQPLQPPSVTQRPIQIPGFQFLPCSSGLDRLEKAPLRKWQLPFAADLFFRFNVFVTPTGQPYSFTGFPTLLILRT